MSDPLTAAMAVLDDYMAALNRGDEAGRQRGLQFPACAAGRRQGRRLAEPRRLQARRISVARAGDGWDRSKWDERTPIHVGDGQGASEGEVQPLAAADGSLIGRFETIYIVTHQDGHWGIQARSSFRRLSACGMWAGLARLGQGEFMFHGGGCHADPQSSARRRRGAGRAVARRCRPARRTPIKIGELNSYKVFPAFLEPYKKGWELARRGGQRRGRRARPQDRDRDAATTTAIPATRCASPRSC